MLCQPFVFYIGCFPLFFFWIQFNDIQKNVLSSSNIFLKRFFILFANTATVCVEPWPRPETKGGIKLLWILRSYKEKKKKFK